MARFEDVLGVKFTGPFEEFAEGWGARGAFAPPGIDLRAPTRPDRTVAKFIDRHGEGLDCASTRERTLCRPLSRDRRRELTR